MNLFVSCLTLCYLHPHWHFVFRN